MLKPFSTERLAIRQLEVQDTPELTRISDVPAVSQWMAFMEEGFPLEKAQALIASQNDTKEYFFAVRLPDRTLIGAMGVIDHPDGTIEVGYWFGVDYQGKGYASGYVLGEIVQNRRNNKAARHLLTRLLKKQGVAPIRMITDKPRSYRAA